MSYTTEDYLLAFSARTVQQLRQEAIWLNLTTQNQDTRRWVRGAHTVRLNSPDWTFNSTPTPDEGVNPVTRARGGAWPTALRGDQDVLNFTRSGGYAAANEILWEDLLELPWPVADETRARQVYEMQQSIDEDIYADVLGGIAGADTDRLGTATSLFLSRAAPYSATGDVGKLVMDIIDDYSLKCQLNNVNSNVSDSVGRKYAVMNPAVFRQLVVYLRAQKYSWDTLTSQLLQENRVLASRGYMGRLAGVDIISWNGSAIPPAGAAAGTNDWHVVCGVSAAWMADTRPPLVQRFNPEENQISASPAWLMRQAGDYATLEVFGNLMHRYNIRSQ